MKQINWLYLNINQRDTKIWSYKSHNTSKYTLKLTVFPQYNFKS